MKKMNLIFAVMAIWAMPSILKAHCEIPCGIYGDSMRVAYIKEHITTVEKSINKITELSAEKTVNYNQLVRWVSNKEEHAQKIQDIVSQYFLHQRIKIKSEANSEEFDTYTKQLVVLHKILVYTMKTKQTTDLENIEMLRKLIDEFASIYFHKH